MIKEQKEEILTDVVISIETVSSTGKTKASFFPIWELASVHGKTAVVNSIKISSRTRSNGRFILPKTHNVGNIYDMVFMFNFKRKSIKSFSKLVSLIERIEKNSMKLTINYSNIMNARLRSYNKRVDLFDEIRKGIRRKVIYNKRVLRGLDKRRRRGISLRKDR